MKLLSEFSEVFQVDTLNVVERLSTVEASFSIVFQALPNAEVIRSLCIINLIRFYSRSCVDFSSVIKAYPTAVFANIAPVT